MRKAFTLIEILVVLAIIAIAVSVSAVGIGKGASTARLRGATRDAFATMRQARSLALVSQKPCVITYVDSTGEEGSSARIEINTAQLMNSSRAVEAQTLSGDVVMVGGGEAPVAEDGEVAPRGGETTEEILFSRISEEVLKDVRIKVVREGEEDPGYESDAKAKSKISAFSNVDYILGRFEDSRKREQESAASGQDGADVGEKDAEPSSDPGGKGESASFVWETNGRCEPHRVWIYTAGSSPEKGLCISVDRFGAAKVLGKGED